MLGLPGIHFDETLPIGLITCQESWSNTLRIAKHLLAPSKFNVWVGICDQLRNHILRQVPDKDLSQAINHVFERRCWITILCKWLLQNSDSFAELALCESLDSLPGSLKSLAILTLGFRHTHVEKLGIDGIVTVGKDQEQLSCVINSSHIVLKIGNSQSITTKMNNNINQKWLNEVWLTRWLNSYALKLVTNS